MMKLFSRWCRKERNRAAKKARLACSEGHFNHFLDQICRLRQPHGGASFLQIGANDGYTNDPLYPFINSYHLPGICVEPMPVAFELLEKTHAGHPRVTLIRQAIGPKPGNTELFIAGLPDNATEAQHLDATRKATFSLETAIRKSRKECGLDSDDEAFNRVKRLLVPTNTLTGLLSECGRSSVDILQIDAEGEDWNILQQATTLSSLPLLINLEHKGLSPADKSAMEDWFEQAGYIWFEHGRDTCAFRLSPTSDLPSTSD